MTRKKAADFSKTDITMLVLVIGLAVFGLAVLLSTSEYNGRVRFGDSACYFKKQLFATALGMAVMYLVSSIDYHFFLKLGPVAYLISMLLSGAVLLVGQEINGSRRWLNLGPLSFQPSEFAKVAVILFLAWQIEHTKKATKGFGFMCRTMLTLLPIVGLVGSNNLSTAIIILGIGGILVFASNPGYLEFVGLGSAGVGFTAIFRVIVWNVLQSGEIRRSMKRDFRQSRGCMPLAAAEYLAEVSETVCRSWDLFRKHKMI